MQQRGAAGAGVRAVEGVRGRGRPVVQMLLKACRVWHKGAWGCIVNVQHWHLRMPPRAALKPVCIILGEGAGGSAPLAWADCEDGGVLKEHAPTQGTCTP